MRLKDIQAYFITKDTCNHRFGLKQTYKRGEFPRRTSQNYCFVSNSTKLFAIATLTPLEVDLSIFLYKIEYSPPPHHHLPM